MVTKSIAPTPTAAHIFRRILHPYGKGGLVVTLSLWDTGIPCPDADPFQRGTHNWIAYRLYSHGPRAKRALIFEGNDAPPHADPADVAVDVIDRLTRLPGDVGAEDEAWTPTQLDWVLQHGRRLRTHGIERLAWSIPSVAVLRLGFEAVYQRRADGRAATRHQYSSGVVAVAARTKLEARSAFVAALGGQLSALPVFRVGAVSHDAYVLYPHGREWVIQVVDVREPTSPLGESVRFAAANPGEAEAILVSTMGRRESTRPVSVPAPAGVTLPPQAPPRRPRVRARAVVSVVRP